VAIQCVGVLIGSPLHIAGQLPRCSATKEYTFPASNRTEDNSLEARISGILWQWRFSDIADRERVISDSRLALMLEYWFPFDEIPFTRRLGTWCDGIPLLTVSDLNRNAFALAGVGYFPNEFSPFELDFHYANRRDLLTTKIVAVAFALFATAGLPRKSICNAHVIFESGQSQLS
jgi:hypothetical protein